MNFLYLLNGAALGLIQGLTEFLPVSSSGHLLLWPFIFSLPDQGAAFDAVLHLATLLAVVIAFRKRISSLLIELKGRVLGRAPVSVEDSHFLSVIFWVTLPILFVGLVLKFFDLTLPRSPLYVAFNLIFFGILLGLSDRFSRRSVMVSRQLSRTASLALGLAQALAVLPGTSRSGAMITAGLFLGQKRARAIELAFVAGLPAIFLGGLSALHEMLTETGSLSLPFTSLMVGFLVALVSGLASIRILRYLSERFSFWPFVWYRITLGLVIIVLYYGL